MRQFILLIFTIYLATFTNGYGSGNLPPSVCKDMKPGPPHGINEVSQKEDLDPPFLVTATKQEAGFVIGNSIA